MVPFSAARVGLGLVRGVVASFAFGAGLEGRSVGTSHNGQMITSAS